VVLLIVMVGVALAPLDTGQAQSPRRGGVLRIANIGEPPTLDQHLTTSVTALRITNNINEGLFALNSKFEPKPMLVERWTISADRLTYTFTLRRGVKFHNGKDLTSEDVKASLERWGRVSVRGRTLFANVVSITTPDPLTVIIRLRDPYALMLTDLALPDAGAMIFPKEVVDEVGTRPLKRFIGTGPYRFVEHLPDRHIRLDRFDGYAARTEELDGATGRKHAYFDSIYVIPVPDPAVRIAGVQRGEYHFALAIPHDDYDRLRADPHAVPLISVGLPSALNTLFNHRSPLMGNRKIRQAFQAAIDHEALLRAAVGPRRFWQLNPGLMSREHPMWTDAGRELYNQKKPDRARQLLSEAGYRGEPIRWLTTMELPQYGTAAQVAKPMLERVGFVVDLQFLDWASLITRRARPELWDVWNAAWIGPLADPVFHLTLIPGMPVSGFYDNRDMNAMMTLLRRHADLKVRLDLWKRMQKLWYDDAVAIQYGNFFWLNLHRRELKGYADAPMDVWWNAWLEGR
jgi:peptide/nickel transport system substrate-binding protein